MSQLTKNKVKFVHFNGKERDWNNRIYNTSTWVNSIVFGKVWDISNNCNLKIYAGKDSIDSSDYIYDMASLERFIEVEKQVADIQDFLATDASNNFTNEKMQDALENFIKGSKTVNDIKDELAAFEDVVADKLADIDISINLINTTLEETIHWLDESGQWIDPSDGI